MVKMDAVDVQVLQVRCFFIYTLEFQQMNWQFQKTLTNYSASIQQQNAGPSMTPAPSIPPHLQQYRTPTPQSQTPPHVHSHAPTPPQYPNGHGQASQQNYGYGAPSHYGGYGAPQQAPMSGGMLPDALASIPEEQKVR